MSVCAAYGFIKCRDDHGCGYRGLEEQAEIECGKITHKQHAGACVPSKKKESQCGYTHITEQTSGQKTEGLYDHKSFGSLRKI